MRNCTMFVFPQLATHDQLADAPTFADFEPHFLRKGYKINRSTGVGHPVTLILILDLSLH